MATTLLVGQLIVEAHFHSDSSCFALHSPRAYLSNSDCIIQLCGVPSAAYDSQSKYYAQEDRANS